MWRVVVCVVRVCACGPGGGRGCTANWWRVMPPMLTAATPVLAVTNVVAAGSILMSCLSTVDLPVPALGAHATHTSQPSAVSARTPRQSGGGGWWAVVVERKRGRVLPASEEHALVLVEDEVKKVALLLRQPSRQGAGGGRSTVREAATASTLGSRGQLAAYRRERDIEGLSGGGRGATLAAHVRCGSCRGSATGAVVWPPLFRRRRPLPLLCRCNHRLDSPVCLAPFIP